MSESKPSPTPRDEPSEDRRKESRAVDLGDVRIHIDGGTVLSGRLLDRSSHGFRIAVALYTKGLQTGQQVRLIHREGEADARVVWRRESGGVIEAGLFVS